VTSLQDNVFDLRFSSVMGAESLQSVVGEVVEEIIFSALGDEVGGGFLVLSLSPSLQLTALSPIALAIPHNPLFLGGKDGFSPFA